MTSEHHVPCDNLATLEQRLLKVEEHHRETNGQLVEKLTAVERRLQAVLKQLNLEQDDENITPEIVLDVDQKSVSTAGKTVEKAESLTLTVKEDNSEESEREELVPLEETVWDAALVVGLESDDKKRSFVGRANRIMIIILLIVNCAMQGVFLLAIPTTMSGKPYDADTLSALRYQRLITGQALAEMNQVDMQTRTANLCSKAVHNRLAGTWDNIYWYLGVKADGVLSPPGNMICMLAMMIWTLSMYRELRRAMDVAFAVFMLPASTRGTPSITNEGDAGNFLESMGRNQKIFLLVFVFIPRFSIAFSLLYFGLEYLADTPSVGDLILNACALEIIKDVDELLFSAILSRRFHQGVQSIQIHVPHFRHALRLMFAPETTASINGPRWASKRNFLHSLMYWRLVIVAFVMFLGWKIHLEPVYDSTVQAEKIICGYDQNFVYTNQPSSNLPVFATFNAGDNSTGPLQCFYASSFELLGIRAGMEPMFAERNTTLERLVAGHHPDCHPPSNNKSAKSPVACPEKDRTSKLSSLQDTAANQYLSGDDCRDQDVQLQVLRQTCLNTTFSDAFTELKNVIFIPSRVHCAQFAPICDCDKTTCPTDVPWDWVKIIQGVCPNSCGKCQPKSSGNGGGGGGR